MELRIGTRGSRLALIQTELIASSIKARRPDIDIRTEIISTSGDKVVDRPIAEVGGKGAFVDSIEAKLSDGSIDIAVHSGKDVPSVVSDIYSFTAITPRADDRDILLLRDGLVSDILQRSLVIGTSSPRRKELIRRLFPLVQDKLLRGNVPTRVDKLRHGEYDGIILAAAGIDRLGIQTHDLAKLYLDPDIFIPATNQGIIVCETLKNTEAEHLIKAMVDNEELKQLNDILNIERILSSYMNLDCYDAAAVNVKYVSEDIYVVRWFYKDSPICSEQIDTGEAKDIISGRSKKWEKKIKEYVL